MTLRMYRLTFMDLHKGKGGARLGYGQRGYSWSLQVDCLFHGNVWSPVHNTAGPWTDKNSRYDT